MPLTYFDRTTETGSVVEALRHDGAVVVTGVVEPCLVDTIREELRPRLDKSGLDTRGDFNGDRTLRVEAGVLCAAPSAADLVDHDLVVRVADEILLPHCAVYQVGSMSAIELLSGESAQALHRDDSLYPIQNAGMELQIGVMWALDDFTEENGGTRVVLGSHRFIRSWHLPDVSDWEAAVMPKGSALFYMGSLGMAAARTEAARRARGSLTPIRWVGCDRNPINTWKCHLRLPQGSGRVCARCSATHRTDRATTRSEISAATVLLGSKRRRSPRGAMNGGRLEPPRTRNGKQASDRPCLNAVGLDQWLVADEYYPICD